MYSQVELLEFRDRIAGWFRDAIGSFAREHAKTEVCYFCLDSDPKYGYIHLGIQTTKSSRQSCIETRERRIPYRRKLFEDHFELWIENANYQIRANSPIVLQNNAGDFFFSPFAEMTIDQWIALYQSKEYTELSKTRGVSEDYLESRVAYVFWKTYELLIEEKAFDGLTLASPTQLAYCFHDQDPVVVDVLRLPAP